MTPRVIVFAPHPDDETIACGGTIAKRIRQGAEVFLVVMTDGRNSHLRRFGIENNPSPDELAIIRESEARRAAGVLDVKPDRLTFLEFIDGQLQSHIKDARQKVEHLLRVLSPTSVYLPSLGEVHPDHRATYSIVTDALSRLASQPIAFLYNIRPNGSEAGKLRDWIHEDIGSELEIKKRAMTEYKSQTTNFSPLQNGPILNREFLESFMRNPERFQQASTTIMVNV